MDSLIPSFFVSYALTDFANPNGVTSRARGVLLTIRPNPTSFPDPLSWLLRWDERSSETKGEVLGKKLDLASV